MTGGRSRGEEGVRSTRRREEKDKSKGEEKLYLDIVTLQNSKGSATREKRQAIYKKAMSLTADTAVTTMEPKDS